MNNLSLSVFMPVIISFFNQRGILPDFDSFSEEIKVWTDRA